MMYTLAPVNKLLKTLITDDYHLSDQKPGLMDEWMMNGWMNLGSLSVFKRLWKLFVIVFITSFSENKCFDKNKSEGQQLIKILIDLLDYEDYDLRLNSILLLYDKY